MIRPNEGQKRIAILGAGANGASIGMDLIRAGLDVTLVDQWPRHVEAMRKDGLRVKTPQATLEQRVNVLDLCDVATLRQPFDLVLVLVKAYDTRWACQLIEPYVASDGLVVGVQNGMTEEIVAGVVGRERTLGCVIELASKIVSPGLVERHSAPGNAWFAIGSLGPETEGREREVAEVLAHAGKVTTVGDIRSAKWLKLVINCPTLAPTALLGLPISRAMNHSRMRALMIAAATEALLAGIAKGHRVLPLYGLREDDTDDLERVAEMLVDHLVAGVVLEHTTTTVLYDWEHGRRSETDDVNGLAVAACEAAGLDSTVNAAIVEIAQRIERGELTPALENYDLLCELAGFE